MPRRIISRVCSAEGGTCRSSRNRETASRKGGSRSGRKRKRGFGESRKSEEESARGTMRNKKSSPKNQIKKRRKIIKKIIRTGCDIAPGNSLSRNQTMLVTLVCNIYRRPKIHRNMFPPRERKRAQEM